MEIRVIQPGAVFLLGSEKGSYNQALNNDKHFYIVLSAPGKVGLPRCQLMTITSMERKEVTYEVPIILHNKEVSYIAPYNVYTFNESDIDYRSLKGVVCDEPFISKSKFIALLLDLWTLCNYPTKMCEERCKEIITRYNKYCDDFWSNNPDVKEHREETSGFPGYNPKFNSHAHELTAETVEEVEVDETDNEEIVEVPINNFSNRVKELEAKFPSRLVDVTDEIRNELIALVELKSAGEVAAASKRWNSATAVRQIYRRFKKETVSPVAPVDVEEKKEMKSNPEPVVEPAVDDGYMSDPSNWSVSKLLAAKRYINKYRFNMQMLTKFFKESSDSKMKEQIKLILDVCKKNSI